jgi:hypothetical protein
VKPLTAIIFFPKGGVTLPVMSPQLVLSPSPTSAQHKSREKSLAGIITGIRQLIIK